MIRQAEIRVTRMALLLLGAAALGMPGEALGQKKQRDLITREEVLASSQKDGDLHSAIRSLRPHFLQQPRGKRTMGMDRNAAGGYVQGDAKMPDALLYVNDGRVGDISGLKQLLAADVYEVRYLEPAKAAERFGVEASGGAVLVTLVKGIKDPPKPPGR
jgi:hypothetical protein